MSTWYPYRLCCPGCGSAFELSLLKGIHVGRLPAVKADIREGRFQRATCPACARTTQVEAPSVYTDFPNGQYIAVELPFPTDPHAARERQRRVFDQCFTLGPAVATQVGAAIQHRLVFGVAALREKVLAWDAGLDDRVIEALKLELLEASGTDRRAEVLRLTAILPGNHLVFGRVRPPPPSERDEHPIPEAGPVEVGNPGPAGGVRPFRRLGPELLEPITIPGRRYEWTLAHQTRLLAAYPGLRDDWVVDAFDGG